MNIQNINFATSFKFLINIYQNKIIQINLSLKKWFTINILKNKY